MERQACRSPGDHRQAGRPWPPTVVPSTSSQEPPLPGRGGPGCTGPAPTGRWGQRSMGSGEDAAPPSTLCSGQRAVVLGKQVAWLCQDTVLPTEDSRRGPRAPTSLPHSSRSPAPDPDPSPDHSSSYGRGQHEAGATCPQEQVTGRCHSHHTLGRKLVSSGDFQPRDRFY